MPLIVAVRSPVATARATSTDITWSIGSMAERRSPPTWRCFARFITRCCTKARSVLRKRPLRFITADGRTIPRYGYRREDFVDDYAEGADENTSAEGFCTTAVRADSQ